MEKKFRSDEIPLAELLRDAADGDLQLPDFQRGWVWDDNHIRSLLASISLSYPIGALMTLKTGNSDVRFAPRPLEGATCHDVEPDLLLLDGQQRMTSLFLALKSKDPVPTRDAKKNKVSRHYYIDIDKSIDPDIDREDAIFGVPEDRIIRTDFGKTIKLDLSNRSSEIENNMFPLDIVLDQNELLDWQMEFVRRNVGTQDDLVDKWKRFSNEIIQSFSTYQIPVIELAKSTQKEAVCQVFEKVNTGGVTLTVFELLTATYAVDDFNLRQDWIRRSQEFGQQKFLNEIGQTDFLQIVTLLSTYDRRRKHIAEKTTKEKMPGVSCKRRDVLRLPLADYKKWADEAMKGLERAVTFLREECLFRRKDLPYASQLIPLSAILAIHGQKTLHYSDLERLRKWFWCGVFGELYSGMTETRFANDIQDCIPWLEGGDDLPRTVVEAQFQADRLLTLRTRNSAAYKGLYALQMKRGGRNFHTNVPIDDDGYFDYGIDIFHVFPKSWCLSRGFQPRIVDCIVNKAAMSSQLRRLIGGSAPSAYLQKIEKEQGMQGRDLDGILRSHDIDPVALRHDKFELFFNQRFERLLQQIGEVMGKPVNRRAGRDESPFFHRDESQEQDIIQSIIQRGESQDLEFKSTGLKNLHTGQKDSRIEWAIVRSVCGFLNSTGGILLVGVDDSGDIVGIDQDFPLLKSKNTDGWQLWFTDLVSNILGHISVTNLHLDFFRISGKTVARIDVNPSMKPVFARELKGPKEHFFYVRMHASTRRIAGPDLLEYQKEHFPDS